MSTKVPDKVRLPETPVLHGDEPQALHRPRFSRQKLALAFTLAALADGLSIFLAFTPPVQWTTDVVTAFLLFMVLGWQWVLLPGLIMEAIPGLYVFPFWVLVVGAMAMVGDGAAKTKLRGDDR